jgi:large subunit ribosomal protein L49
MIIHMKHVLPRSCNARAYSQAIQASQHALPTPGQGVMVNSALARHSYFVRRNSRGSLPVYTDIRNGGTRYHVQIRNVEGRINVSCIHILVFPSLTPPRLYRQALAAELKQSLFNGDSPEASRLVVKVQGQRHITLTGGRFKRDVATWLTEKGF